MLNLLSRIFRSSRIRENDQSTSFVCPIHLEPGDLIFVERKSFVFRRVSEISQSWTSHVGIVLPDERTGELVVFESCVPLVKRTPICKFMTRPVGERVEVRRLKGGLTPSQIDTLTRVAKSHLGRLYDTGFNLESKKRMFCSRFVYEVYRSIGIEVGKSETFGELAMGAMQLMNTDQQRESLINFWKRWFLTNSPPVDRPTITPATQLRDPQFETIFSNHFDMT